MPMSSGLLRLCICWVVACSPACDLAEQSFVLKGDKLWHPLQAGAAAGAAAADGDEEEVDDDDSLLLVKLPSLQSGSLLSLIHI